jgi:phosphate transport system substrate-binding protein
MKKFLIAGLAVLVPALFASSAMAAETINAAGATFPAPIYQKWFEEYKAAHPEVQINYQSIGSGGGIRQLTEGTVDFGASDAPMTDEQIKAVKIKPLHFPTVMGAVVMTYNLPGVTALKLSAEAIAGMYLGTITKWNDPKIAADNKGVNLPEQGHRNRSPLRRQRNDLHLHRLPLQDQPRLENQSRRERFRELAAGTRRQR